MGWTFGNLHVRKANGLDMHRLGQEITAYYGQQGFRPCEESEAELHLALLSGDDSGWISVYSDDFSEPPVREAIGSWLAKRLQTLVLDIGCFDSDVLGLILYDPDREEPAQAAIGFLAQQMGLSLISEEGWSKLVPDLSAFRDKVEGEYVLAETALIELAEDLDLPEQYARTDLESLADSAQPAPLELYFTAF